MNDLTFYPPGEGPPGDPEARAVADEAFQRWYDAARLLVMEWEHLKAVERRYTSALAAFRHACDEADGIDDVSLPTVIAGHLIHWDRTRPDESWRIAVAKCGFIDPAEFG